MSSNSQKLYRVLQGTIMLNYDISFWPFCNTGLLGDGGGGGGQLKVRGKLAGVFLIGKG